MLQVGEKNEAFHAILGVEILSCIGLVGRGFHGKTSYFFIYRRIAANGGTHGW